MIHINWNPVGHMGPIPINWYGLGWAAAFLVGWMLTRRWAARGRIAASVVEDVLIWVMVGSLVGARLYFVVQNDPAEYLRQPWRIFAIWEGGLAFFGGLFGGILAAWLYTRRGGLPFAQIADLFAPAIPIGAAIGRMACGLDGMDYGTPTSLPWGVVYENPASYAPTDGVPRHPDQFYELAGDLLIAGVLLKLRPRLPAGATFLLYLVLFSVLRFVLFFVRGNVPIVAFGLKNAQWTALAILVIAVPLLLTRLRHGSGMRAPA
jgi:phosphatidylglycerol---prolipoprotein diacylglyceryl transferase